MDTTDSPDRWTEIRKLHGNEKFIYQIMGGAALVALGILLGAAIFAQDGGYATNLYTEILSIIVTVFILNLLAERRDEQKLKAQLIRDAASQYQDDALRAVDEIAKREWLTGENGILKGANLSGANLKDAILWGANLQDAILWEANLQEAGLMNANLQGAFFAGANLQNAGLMSANLLGTELRAANLLDADLRAANLQHTDLFFANLQDANLRAANLQGAILWGANLQSAILWEANLQGANFAGANLQNAKFKDAEFDENTTLPDGSHWTPDADVTRFTDPNHTNFWRSDNPYSPAYRGEDETTSKD